MKETNIRVQLIDYTGAGHPDPNYAGRLLAFTKSTRLNMTPDGWDRFLAMPVEELAEELRYMVSTLPSSWEFANATFCVLDVSRACAQQITRTRWSPMEGDIFGSYAMQAQRVVDVSQVGVHIPEAVRNAEEPVVEFYEDSMQAAMERYRIAVQMGVANEDARGLLPMHVASNLVVQFNLRSLTELCRKRSSLRVQGEYNEVVRQMRELIIGVWPWSAPFFEPKESIASALLEEIARDIDGDPSLSPSRSRDLKNRISKAADLIKVG